MAIWTNIVDALLAVDAPIRSLDIKAIRDNITALAERASGAPAILGANFDVILPYTQYTAVASIPQTSIITSTYKDYLIFWKDFFPATSGRQLGVQVSVDNGANYKTANYAFSKTRTLSSGGVTAQTATADSLDRLTGDVGNAVSGGARGFGILIDPLGTLNRKTLLSFTGYNQSIATQIGGGGWDGGDDAINAFKFVDEAGGNITAKIAIIGFRGL